MRLTFGELFAVTVVILIAGLFTPKYDIEEFERTERIQEHVSTLGIQQALNQHRGNPRD